MLKVLYENIGFFIILIIIIQLPACNCNKIKNNVDVSNIQLNVDIKRFDKAIRQIDTTNISTSAVDIYRAYPIFFPFYIEEVMQFGKFSKADTALYLAPFQQHLTNNYVREVLDTMQQAFPHLNDFEQDLTLALKYFKYYFPDKGIPQFVAFPSNFTYAALSFDTLIIAVGLDMYLGSNYKYYRGMYPAYLYHKFTPHFMLPNTLNVLGSMCFNYPTTDNTFLEKMINEGKKLYLLDLLMPDFADHIKMGYTADEQAWCSANEADIWYFFIESDLLYSTNAKLTDRYFDPAPSSSGMPAESPGRVGAWAGRQIVNRFMQRHPEISYNDLINQYDAQTILSLSKYKPKK